MKSTKQPGSKPKTPREGALIIGRMGVHFYKSTCRCSDCRYFRRAE